VTLWNGSEVDFTNLSLRATGLAVLPRARVATVSELGVSGQWLEVRGTVRVADPSQGRLILNLEGNGRSCVAMIMGRLGANDFKELIGAGLSIRGIDVSEVVNGQVGTAQLMVSGIGEVAISTPSTLRLSQMPVTSIDALLSRELGPWTNLPVHVNGLIVSYKPGQSFVVKDATGQIRVQANQAPRAQPDERINVWGWLALQTNETALKAAYVDVASPPAPARDDSSTTNAPAPRGRGR